MEKANADIRKMIEDKGLKHWMVASKLNISKDTFCVWLRQELTPDRKREVLKAIKSFGKK